jgi:hypothetical protein
MANRHNRMHFYGIVMFFSCAGVLLSGCAGITNLEIHQKTKNVPPHVELESVPFFPQKAYQCGPAALATVFSWSGLSISPEDLTPEVFTPGRKGSLQTALISAARRHGRIAYPFKGWHDLFSEVGAGHPAIILQNLGLSWFPIWHYAVVVGFDLSRERVLLRSGTLAKKWMSFRVFENTWNRGNHWGLLILKPTQLPATAEKDRFLAAVLGLEKARQFDAAIDGYKTALERWPENLTAMMGIGNSHYALGAFKKAESAFRKAVRLHSESGPAYNNLAQSLLEQGRKQEALKAAEKAVSLGGPLASEYQRTLEEIQSACP